MGSTRARGSLEQQARRLARGPRRLARRWADLARTRGDDVECPVCGRMASAFLPFRGRPDARCAGCLAMERHRMLWLYLESVPELTGSALRVLHFAPEPHVGARLRDRPNLEYVTADLMRDDVDLQLDVTALDLPDESFDVVICIHVLEHVSDAHQAVRELHRITRPAGWAALSAPVDPSRETTYEDWSITEPDDRARAFGQANHVRWFGRDYADVLRGGGWQVDVRPIPLTDEQRARHGIPRLEEDLYICRRG